MEKLDCVVVGAVGLAVVRSLTRFGREAVILDSAEKIGMEASSRTGEVVHAGIHCSHGSLRASLCVKGREGLTAGGHYRFVKKN